MQSSDRILAHRYAQALFQVGLEHKEEERLYLDLSQTLKLLHDHMEVFRQPMLGVARQKTLLKNLVGTKISARTLKFLELLIDKKRFFLLSLATTDYGNMLDIHRGVVRAQVSAAVKLTESELSRLSRDLKAFIGKEVVLEAKEAPELLGGMVVRMGDWALDGSLQGKLRRLAAQLVEES